MLNTSKLNLFRDIVYLKVLNFQRRRAMIHNFTSLKSVLVFLVLENHFSCCLLGFLSIHCLGISDDRHFGLKSP